MKIQKRVILVSLYFAVMFAYAAASAYIFFTQHSRTNIHAIGWTITPRDGRLFVSNVIQNGPAAALRIEDEIVALDDKSAQSSTQVIEFFKRVQPGASYTIIVRRAGQQEAFTLQTARPPLSWWADIVLECVLLPAIFLSTGLALFLLKPYDKQALILALLFGTLVSAFPGTLNQPWWLAVLIQVGAFIDNNPSFPLFLHFCLVFPERSPLLKRYPRLEWYIYLPFLVFCTPVLMALKIPQVHGILVSLSVFAGMLLLINQYRHSDQVSRRRVRVVIGAFFVAALPYLVYTIFRLIEGVPPLGSTGQWAWLDVLGWVGFLLVPPAWAYAIVRHRVIPVSLMIRRSVQYLFAKNALRILLALPLIGIVLTIAANPQRTLSEILFRNSIYFYLLFFVTASISLLFRKRLTDWIDRKFFREQYKQEEILHGLIDEVRRSDSIGEMARLVSSKVDSALHPEHIYLFYRDEAKRDFPLGFSSGGSARELRIPEDFLLLRFMENCNSAQDFPVAQKNNLPQSEKDWLTNLGTSLMVPMTGTDERLAGLLLLGPKKSEVPYTRNDRELLETLADQIALAYENVRLKERVDHERKIKQEVLTRIDAQNFNLLKECPACGRCYDRATEVCSEDRTELTLTLPVERTIDSRYRLDKLIGKGGMGAVYEALDKRLNRRVAVKILIGSMFGNRQALSRFEREAQASARLNHPNIIPVHDYGVLSADGAYLVMELARGENLRTVIERDRLISSQLAADWFDQMLEGLKAAHSAGIIHRDLKPENILIVKGDDGRAKVIVLDFGLAKIKQSTPDSQSPTAYFTAPGTVMGTCGYISPEQLSGGTVDERSDLFSIGVMAVEAITGKRPFPGKTHQEVLHQILHSSFQLQGNSEGARRLARVLQKCLAKDSAERYRTAEELQSELIPALREYEISDRYVGSHPGGDTAVL
ncbi:MAG: protein kinase [Pyrinomonadaceae bacterium]